MQNNLASERVRKGLTQSELAKKIGVTEKSICRWESGDVLPSAKYLKSLHTLFGCSTDYLLGLTDERKG